MLIIESTLSAFPYTPLAISSNEVVQRTTNPQWVWVALESILSGFEATMLKPAASARSIVAFDAVFLLTQAPFFAGSKLFAVPIVQGITSTRDKPTKGSLSMVSFDDLKLAVNAAMENSLARILDLPVSESARENMAYSVFSLNHWSLRLLQSLRDGTLTRMNGTGRDVARLAQRANRADHLAMICIYVAAHPTVIASDRVMEHLGAKSVEAADPYISMIAQMGLVH